MKKRWAWVLTGSGHFNECISLINELEDVDVFVSKAAEEVLIMYKKKNDLSPKVKFIRIIRPVQFLWVSSIKMNITL